MCSSHYLEDRGGSEQTGEAAGLMDDTQPLAGEAQESTLSASPSFLRLPNSDTSPGPGL